jgi:tRNA pseudouridine55 synthase
MYSAVKQGGVPLHRLARQGEEVRRAPKKVRIHRLELVEFASPDASLLVECSAGTYVRTLVADLGQTLGCGGYLLRIRRLRSGPFRVEQSLPAEACERAAQEDRLEDHFIRPAAALGVPEVTLADVAAHRIMNGGDVPVGTVIRLAPGSKAMAYDEQGRLLALVELRPDRRLYPLRVLRVAS